MASTASVAHDRHRTLRQSWPLATAALGTVALAATAGALGVRLVAVWPEALSAGGRSIPGALAIDSLVAVPLLATGAAAAAWWAASLLLITVSLAAERAGLHSAALVRCIHAVAPRTLRRLAVAGVGAGLTFSALPAQAAPAPPDVGWTSTQDFGDAAPAQPADAAPPAPHPTADPMVPPEQAPTAPPAPPVPGPGVGAGSDQQTPTTPPDPTSLGAVVPLIETPAPPAVTSPDGEDRPVGAPPAAAPSPQQPPIVQPPPVQSPFSQSSSAQSPAAQSPSVQSPSVQSPAAQSATAQPSAGQPRTAPTEDAERPDLAAGVIVVAPGDSLWRLAAEALPAGATDAEIATTSHAWYTLNRAVIGEDPDLLHPGQLLQAPPHP